MNEHTHRGRPPRHRPPVHHRPPPRTIPAEPHPIGTGTITTLERIHTKDDLLRVLLRGRRACIVPRHIDTLVTITHDEALALLSDRGPLEVIVDRDVVQIERGS